MKYNNQQIGVLEKKDLIKFAETRNNAVFTLSFYLGLKHGVNFRSEANSILSSEAERVKKEKAYSKKARKKILAMLNLVKKEISLLRLPSKARTLVFFLDDISDVAIYRISVYIRSQIVIKTDRYICPLVKAMEKYPKYLMVAIDRDKADFYRIFRNEIVAEPEKILSDVPKKIRTSSSDDWKGRRAKRIERHIEDHLKKHFKVVAAKISDYLKKNSFNYLIIGGHEEIKAKFRKFLDKKSVEKLVGFFSLPHCQSSLIKEKSMAVIDRYEKKSEEKMISGLSNGVERKKWAAVVGIDSVLENFYHRNIKLIIVGKNFEKAGYVCGYCHYIYLFPGDCSRCGGKTAIASNLIDEIMEEAIKNNINIKQLFHSHKIFDRFGIGAFLKSY